MEANGYYVSDYRASTTVDRTSTYPLGDYGHPADKPHGTIRAQWTGEFRPPKRGEYYLSGAIVEAYRAPNDLTTSYHIAKLWRIEYVVTERLHEL